MPTISMIVFIILTCRFAGFPFKDSAWESQATKMTQVVLLWTFGNKICAVFFIVSILISNTNCDIAKCVFCTEFFC